MKSFLTTILLLICPVLVFAADHYVLIDNASGEVISTIPVTDNWEPNANELRNMQVVVMDITEDEGYTLLKMEENGVKKNKVDLKKIESIDVKEKVSEALKNEIFTDINTKSVVVNP